MVYKQIRQGISHALHSLLPYTCVLCGAKGDQGRDLCTACAIELPYITSACERCGLALPEMEIEAGRDTKIDCVRGEPVDSAQDRLVEPEVEDLFYSRQWSRELSANEMRCGQCIKKPPTYQKAISLFSYEPPISWLIQGLKFNIKLQYGRVMADLMVQRLQNYLDRENVIKPDLIIPVPLHRNRLRTRGFNQALEIAKPVAEVLSIPLDINSCVRILDTPSQSDLPAKKRRANVRKAFAIVEKIAAKRIVLIDDVMTTGATVNELAKLLLKNGTEYVEVWTIARTHK